MQSKNTYPKGRELLALSHRAPRRLPLEEMAEKVADPENQRLFWKKVNKNGPMPDTEKYPLLLDRCWEWTGSLSGGYGLVAKWNWNCAAHRFSYQMNVGSITSTDFEVCHRCDNAKCVNPSHLFLGYHKDNMKDMVSKGRSGRLPGERHGRSKLKESDVIEIRRRYKSGESSFQIAADYGMSEGSIGYAISGKNWKHLPGAVPLRKKHEFDNLTLQPA